MRTNFDDDMARKCLADADPLAGQLTSACLGGGTLAVDAAVDWCTEIIRTTTQPASVSPEAILWPGMAVMRAWAIRALFATNIVLSLTGL
jgi:hypothetical protein